MANLNQAVVLPNLVMGLQAFHVNKPSYVPFLFKEMESMVLVQHVSNYGGKY